MSRSYPLTGVRMHPDLKERLIRESKISGRSLNTEIINRLQTSLDAAPPYAAMTIGIAEPGQGSSNTVQLSDHERQLLTEFKRLPVEKQLALLSLLK